MILQNILRKTARKCNKKAAARQLKAGRFTSHNNGMVVQGGVPPFSQIAKVFCGRAFVSVHLRPVSTHSLRSFGHRPRVHGTTAQYKLATSPCLNVVRNGYAQDKKAKYRKAVYAERQRPASCRAKTGNIKTYRNYARKRVN